MITLEVAQKSWHPTRQCMQLNAIKVKTREKLPNSMKGHKELMETLGTQRNPAQSSP